MDTNGPMDQWTWNFVDQIPMVPGIFDPWSSASDLRSQLTSQLVPAGQDLPQNKRLDVDSLLASLEEEADTRHAPSPERRLGGTIKGTNVENKESC